MTFADLALSRRLERAEGYSCAQHAAARGRVAPDVGAEWMEHAGAYAAFDGRESPITQSFGLGLLEPLTTSVLEVFEHFFESRGARVEHEMSPFAGADALALLCARGYRPIEVSSVLCRPVSAVVVDLPTNVRVRVIDSSDGEIWTDVCIRGWSHMPELREILQDLGTITLAREATRCFLAEIDGAPAGAALLALHDGIALFGGSSTVPELRRRGTHTALLDARMRHAQESGCELAMVVAPPGSDSQRNAERTGFRLAYTRTKWRRQSGVKPDSV
jgi:GNAT superfamily N-acetyltransferase